jgi:hypothetical protein
MNVHKSAGTATGGSATYRLVAPRFDRVDLVDKGANLDLTTNDGSHVMLFKRETPTEKNEMPDPVKKEAEQENKSPTVEELQAQLATEKKRAEEAEAALAKSAEKKEDKQVPTDPVEFLKSAPKEVADLFKSIQSDLATAKADAQESKNIAKAEREKRKLVEFTKSAEQSLSHLEGDAATKGKLLLDLSEKLSQDEFKSVSEMLVAADKKVEKSSLFSEVGRGGGAVTTAEERIQAIAKSFQEKDSKLTPEQAQTKALMENPELYDDYLHETER